MHTIEAGFPASSVGEAASVKEIAAEGLESLVCGLSRSLKSDVDKCLDSNVDMVHIFIPTSEIQRTYTIRKSHSEVLEITGGIISYAKDHCKDIMFSAMDATRTEPDKLIEVYQTAVNAGATVINVPDTVGVMAPSGMKELIAGIRPNVNCPIDVHCHNDFGLAVANTISGVEAGASQVQVTVNGIGERAGNADLAQITMILESIYGIDTGITTEKLLETSHIVSHHSGIPVPDIQPVVGDNAFAHESGIHSQGVLANTSTFEPGIMTPEMVGHRRRLKLGKHVGRHAIRQMLTEVNIEPDDNALDEIVVKVKQLSISGKQVTDNDLYQIADTVMGTSEGDKAIRLNDITIMTGNNAIPTASIRAEVCGSAKTFCSTGNGSIDAAMKTIMGIVPDRIILKKFNIASISGGTDALGNVTITVQDEQGRLFDAGSSGSDVVLASVEALINAINLVHRAKQ